MQRPRHDLRWSFQFCCMLLFAAIATTTVATLVSAGFRGNRNAVGGIAIDADGVVQESTVELRDAYRQHLRDTVRPAENALAQPTALRKISLRGIEQALSQARQNGGADLPDEIRFLAGIQRIQYIFIYPEQNDIVIAGPGEGWRVSDKGEVVGVTTGMPVLRLDDFMVALRTVQNAREEGITCSIDPTAEGRQRLEELMARQMQFTPEIVDAMAQALGPQQITLTGIPETSRMARVLVAADYRMKRIAMKLEPTPLRGLPSYLDMLPARAAASASTPRWWLACNYEPLARSADGLAWEIRGPGVKCLTEEEVVENGEVRAAERENPTAKRWADTMTEKYEELSKHETIFAELRNVMDLCVLAAAIERHGLLARADCELPILTGRDGNIALEEWHAPKTIATQASVIRKGRNYILTASGGVDIESWQIADRTAIVPETGDARQKSARGEEANWWWN